MAKANIKNWIICLMGPTASGKTPLAIEMVKHFPCEIISVDSAMVYKGMDIGTAKPSQALLKIAPHHLIDRVDPKEIYSVGQFRSEALAAIEEIIARGKTPLLVGGTMMYFRALQKGLANLPKADPAIRAQLQTRAQNEGWEALHSELKIHDPIAASRIHANDAQRIQRALEVFLLTGKTISESHAEDTNPLAAYRILNIALAPSARNQLHERIATRFKEMLATGLVEEVQHLFRRGDLSAELPALRSVGYREVWEYLLGHLTYDQMQEQAIIATRQLAKRQMTWLRSWSDLHWIDSDSDSPFTLVRELLLTHCHLLPYK